MSVDYEAICKLLLPKSLTKHRLVLHEAVETLKTAIDDRMKDVKAFDSVDSAIRDAVFSLMAAYVANIVNDDERFEEIFYDIYENLQGEEPLTAFISAVKKQYGPAKVAKKVVKKKAPKKKVVKKAKKVAKKTKVAK